MAQGIDSEYDCTQYAHQIAEKYTFVGRYYRMPPPYSHYPTLTRLETQALSAAGLSLASIWEYISGSQGRIESLNYNAGLNEGGRAYKQALALPQPDGTPIYFAVDEGYDPQKPEYAGPIDDYFKGVNDAFAQAAGPGNQPKYAIGVYGPGAVCAWLKGKGGSPQPGLRTQSCGRAIRMPTGTSNKGSASRRCRSDMILTNANLAVVFGKSRMRPRTSRDPGFR